MRCLLALPLLLGISFVHAQEPTPTKPATAFDKWEKEIAALEKRDAEAKVAKGGIVFVGSSSIRLWDLKKSFPDLQTVNHGFGGSKIADSVHFFDRLVKPLEPKIVVFYAGDNDLAGKEPLSPDEAFADFQALLKQFNEKLPQAKLIYIPVKPSPSRWKLYDKQSALNALIRKALESDSQRYVYLDIVKPMLNEKGEPREELFKKDMLHMNDEGYAIWAKELAVHLK